jgi:hypothetical protein
MNECRNRKADWLLSGRIPTNGSGSLSAIDEDREHKQDWTVTTDEKDSWANKERRRSSVWGKLELVPYVSESLCARCFSRSMY